MLEKLSARLTYANAASTLALFIALGGVSYAAVKLPRNSVGSAQLKRNAVTGIKIKNRAVTSTKIGAAAVTGFHVDESTLAPVPEAAHAATAASASVSRLAYETATVVVAASNYPASPATATASCPAGLTAVGGGARVGDDASAYVNDAGPASRTSWEATAFAHGANATTMTVTVVCAPAASVTP